ncbi:MAG: hypothetical protein ACOC7P_01155 [Chloroflexota bacterium]
MRKAAIGIGIGVAVVILALSICLRPATPSNYIYEDGRILVGGDDEPIELINNPDATNPTYAELIVFVKEDPADEHYYAGDFAVLLGTAEVSYVCSDFAEDMHNNAEAAGIRAAWVSIDFEGDDKGHALNAFETTDRGLVYIDCTGKGALTLRVPPAPRDLVKTEQGTSLMESDPTSWDKVAYVEIGKEYGLIPLEQAESPSYSFYEEFKREWERYERLLNDYNDEVARYNQEIQGKIYYEGTPELASIEAWEASLLQQEQQLHELQSELGDFRFEPLGIVEDINVYWGNSQ